MSHAITARVAKMRNLSTLEKALGRMGVSSVHFVRNQNITYFGRNHHVDLGVKAGSKLGNHYSFGYRKLPDGQLELVRESMESHEASRRIDQDVLQNYISIEVDNTLQSLGFDLESTQTQGQELRLTYGKWS